MAVQWESKTMTRAGDVWSEYPEDILIVPELNGRHILPDITGLAADIEATQQNTPVPIRKNDAGQSVLIAGHSRWRAIVALNEKNAEAIATNPKLKRKVLCTYHRVTEQEAFLMAISENRFRNDTSPMDDASNIQKLQTRFGYGFEDIAKFYFPETKDEKQEAAAQRWVKDRLSLLELAPEAADAVRQGRVKITAAVALAKLSKAQQREKVKGEGRIKGKDLKPIVEDVPAPLPKSAPPLVSNKIAVAAKALFKDDLTLVDLNCEDNEWLSVSRSKMQKLYLALEGKVSW